MASRNAKWINEYLKDVMATVMTASAPVALQRCGNLIYAVDVKGKPNIVVCNVHPDYRSVRWHSLCSHGTPLTVGTKASLLLDKGSRDD